MDEVPDESTILVSDDNQTLDNSSPTVTTGERFPEFSPETIVGADNFSQQRGVVHMRTAESKLYYLNPHITIAGRTGPFIDRNGVNRDYG